MRNSFRPVRGAGESVLPARCPDVHRKILLPVPAARAASIDVHAHPVAADQGVRRIERPKDGIASSYRCTSALAAASSRLAYPSTSRATTTVNPSVAIDANVQIRAV